MMFEDWSGAGGGTVCGDYCIKNLVITDEGGAPEESDSNF